MSSLGDKWKALRKRTSSARQGKELLDDILPQRAKTRKVWASTPEECVEVGIAKKSRDLLPREMEATQEILLELPVSERRELECDVVAAELQYHWERRPPFELEAARSNWRIRSRFTKGLNAKSKVEKASYLDSLFGSSRCSECDAILVLF